MKKTMKMTTFLSALALFLITFGCGTDRISLSSYEIEALIHNRLWIFCFGDLRA